MQAIRIKRTLSSSRLDIPELEPLIGKTVEIIVLEDAATPDAQIEEGPKPGSAKGQIYMSADFDEPLEDFKPYME